MSNHQRPPANQLGAHQPISCVTTSHNEPISWATTSPPADQPISWAAPASRLAVQPLADRLRDRPPADQLGGTSSQSLSWDMWVKCESSGLV